MAKVLIVEDEKLMRDMLRRLLEKEGHVVRVAGDGREGLRLFEEERPDLTLLDRDLPGLTGSQVLARIRMRDRGAVVVILSAHAGGEEKYHRLGANAFLSKAMDVDEVLGAVSRHAAGASPSGAPDRAGRRPEAGAILVVDDEPAVRKVLRRFLERQGHRVVEAATGEEALKVVEAARPLATFLDLKMPGIGGHETLRRMRESDPEAFIVVVSANTDAQDALDCLKLGARDYLLKPFSLDYLERTVLPLVELLGPEK